LKVGFNGGNTWIDKAIQTASGSEYCNVTHAFIYVLDSVLEARGVKESADKYPGVWLHNPSKFSDDDTVKIIDVDVPDEEAAVQKARELIGTPYSYTDCIEAALNEVGVTLPTDGETTVMCSETVTMILRAGGVEVCGDTPADLVTPVMLYEALRG
jgi:hypothetical protein